MTTHVTTLIRKLAHSPEEFDGDYGSQHFLPIVPSSRLWLPKLGIGNDERFAAIFRETWKRLPMRDRRRIVRHWREDSLEAEIYGYWSPLIELVDKNHPSNLQPRDFGVSSCDGHSLDFFAPAVDAMSAS